VNTDHESEHGISSNSKH